MRKLISILLIAIFVFASCVPAHAMLNRFTKEQQITLWTVVNDCGSPSEGDATGTVITIAPSSKVTANRTRILGYTITATRNNYEGYAAIYDCNTAAEYNGSTGAGVVPPALESEAELLTTDGSMTILFPYPYMVTDGITLFQGANTAVTVYLEDTYGPS